MGEHACSPWAIVCVVYGGEGSVHGAPHRSGGGTRSPSGRNTPPRGRCGPWPVACRDVAMRVPVLPLFTCQGFRCHRAARPGRTTGLTRLIVPTSLPGCNVHSQQCASRTSGITSEVQCMSAADGSGGPRPEGCTSRGHMSRVLLDRRRCGMWPQVGSGRGLPMCSVRTAGCRVEFHVEHAKVVREGCVDL